MKTTAIILSAGKGKRMGLDIPKQYVKIGDKPILFYTLQAFEKSPVEQIIVVAGADDITYVREEIVAAYGMKKVQAVVEGGKERYDSVYAGLKAAEGSDVVLIHDGARPFVTEEVIVRTIEGAREYGAALAAVPVTDTIKIADKEGKAESTPDRSRLYAAQTPQSFRYDLVKEAFDKMYQEEAEVRRQVTDDVMVVQKYAKVRAKIVEGSYGNIKITTPEDLLLLKNAEK